MTPDAAKKILDGVKDGKNYTRQTIDLALIFTGDLDDKRDYAEWQPQQEQSLQAVSCL